MDQDANVWIVEWGLDDGDNDKGRDVFLGKKTEVFASLEGAIAFVHKTFEELPGGSANKLRKFRDEEYHTFQIYAPELGVHVRAVVSATRFHL